MHVLVIPSWYPTSEAPLRGIYFAEQAQLLHNYGLKVGIVYPEQQSLRHLSWDALRRNYFQTTWTTEQGIPTLRHHGWNVWSRFPPGMRLRVRQALRLAHRYVGRHGVPDVIHAHSARWAGAAAARISETLEVPYVLTEHFSGLQRNEVPPWRWPLVEEGFRHAEGLATVSTPLKETITAYNLAEPSNVIVQPNPVQASLFTLPPSGRSTPPPFRLVTVAHLNPRKNISGLLTAFRTAFGNSSAVSLTIVGDGSQREVLEQRVSRRGLSPQVSFAGSLGREAVRDALWDAHAFVLASHHETFGIVCIEAMATGLPVVATRCGGPEDIVTDETGQLVPPDDPDALAKTLQTMQTQWASYDPDRIRAYVLDEYGPEPFVQRTRSLYRRAREAVS